MFDEEKIVETIKDESSNEKYKKPDAIEKIRRLNIVIKLLIDGQPVNIIRQNLTKQFGMSSRSAYRYILEAGEYFKEQSKADIQKEIGKALRRYELIISKHINNADENTRAESHKIVLQAQKELKTLLGLDAKSKLELEGELNINAGLDYILSQFPKDFSESIRGLLAEKLTKGGPV